MAASRTISADLGVPPENYIEESFDAAVIDDAPPPMTGEAVLAPFKVEFAKQGRTIDVTSDQTVLSCAKKPALKSRHPARTASAAPANRNSSAAPSTCTTTAASANAKSTPDFSCPAVRNRSPI